MPGPPYIPGPKRKPTNYGPEYTNQSDLPASYYIAQERQIEIMEAQMEMQAKVAAQQAALQQQQMDLSREQMLKQEQAAQLANVESTKTPNDFIQANAGDQKRRQLLRRGLMSTFTRYGGEAGQKSYKLGA